MNVFFTTATAMGMLNMISMIIICWIVIVMRMVVQGLNSVVVSMVVIRISTMIMIVIVIAMSIWRTNINLVCVV